MVKMTIAKMSKTCKNNKKTYKKITIMTMTKMQK